MQLLRRTFALALACTAFAPASAQEGLSVQAVNYPLAHFAKRIAGDLADVTYPVPADADPTTWAPSVEEIEAIQSADLILLNGAGFAAWPARTSLPRARVVVTSEAFSDRFIPVEAVVHSHGDAGEHSHGAVASHTWLDFGLAARQAESVTAGLTRAAPEHEGDFAARLAPLVQDLDRLDGRARVVAAQAGEARLIASHPVYQYFALGYGLAVDSVHWEPEEAPDAAGWAEFETLRGAAPHVLMIWEAEPLADTRQRLEAEGVEIVVFPTLFSGPPGTDFVATMHASLDRLEQAFSD